MIIVANNYGGLDAPQIGAEVREDRSKLRRGAWAQYVSALKPDWATACCEENDYLAKRGYSPEVLEQFDVRIEQYTDWPILIPLKSRRGKFAGFVRRRINGDETERKYIYNRGFSKNDTLIGNYRNGTPIVIVEGILDMLKVAQHGCSDYVCMFGWHASPRQIEMLSRVTDTLVGALDNTPKGKEGLDALRKHFKIIKFVYPNKSIKDPGDMSIYQFNYAMQGYRRAIRPMKSTHLDDI
jgi:DNA primase